MPPSRGGRRWRRARELSRAVALVLACAAVTYLVAMNVFLGTRLFRDAVSYDPDALLVDYRSAYSLWPGRIHAEGLSIRGRDHRVEWILRIERVDLRVSLGELAHRAFHAEHVRADDVSFRVRRRQDVVSPETMAALPPIPGFLDPPLADVGPPLPPLTDADYNLWSIRLEDVSATRVREVWVDTIRYTGALEIHGRWFFRPLRWLDVGPATVEQRSLDVSLGRVEPWVSGVSGRVEVTVHPFDLVEVPDGEIVDQLSIHGALSGLIEGTNLARRVLERTPVTVQRAEAPFAVRAEIDHGVVGPGTHLRTEPFAARATARGLVVDASLELDAQVVDGGVGYADLRVEGARVSARGPPRATVKRVAATLATRDLDLARQPFERLSYALRVDGAELDSLGDWRALLPVPSDLEVDSGRVTLGGELRGDLRRATGAGEITADVRSVSVARRGLRVAGDVTAVARVNGSLEEKRIALTGSVATLHAVHASLDGVTVHVPSLEARAPDLRATKTGLVGRVVVDVPDIQLPSLAALGPHLRLPRDVAIEGGRGAGRVHMDLDLTQLACDGEATVTAHDLSLRVAGEHLRGDLTVSLRARQTGPVTDVSGTDVAFRSAGEAKTLDWWGRMRLTHASFRIQPRFRFDTEVSAAAKDGTPLTALVVDNTALPGWLIDVVSTRSLEATGQLLLTPSVFAVRAVKAHAQGADVAFEFGKIREEKKEWALLLDLGVALAGVDVADGHTQVLLAGAGPWYRAKVERLEAVERGRE